MRPSGETPAASVKTREAPPTARLPKCTRCQSFAKPSVLEYWHMGETTIRLRRVSSRMVSSSNSMNLPFALCELGRQNILELVNHHGDESLCVCGRPRGRANGARARRHHDRSDTRWLHPPLLLHGPIQVPGCR